MQRQLTLEPATADLIAPFGGLIAASPAAARRTRYYGDAVELFDTPSFRSDADTCLSLARIAPRPREVVWIERHFRHTQAFLPLNAAPWVAVLAPPGEEPDFAGARALRFAGNQGLVMKVGTWHEFPFALEEPVELVVILRNETNRDLEQADGGGATGEDLDKRHVEQRYGLRLRWRDGSDA